LIAGKTEEESAPICISRQCTFLL